MPTQPVIANQSAINQQQAQVHHLVSLDDHTQELLLHVVQHHHDLLDTCCDAVQGKTVTEAKAALQTIVDAHKARAAK